MKVVDCPRTRLYAIVAEAFDTIGCQPAMIELGVHKGDNAELLMEALKPRRSVLIDAWSAEALKAYSHFEALPPWLLPLTAFERYFGGSLSDQATFDRTYEIAVQRFAGDERVEIIRDDTVPACARLRDRHGAGSFDFIYVDANHQYEYVLRDLLHYQDLLAEDGVMMLNDCCHSLKGMNQNLGVLEAVGNFLKRAEFTPVALTSTDMGDLVIARQGSAVVRALDAALDGSDLSFVEVMPQMLPAAHIRVSPQGRARVSFA
ncbi:class I SAM-dependent methyltransferase [Phreatobacter sp.]|uniref:class I SAM-dependent methyltransferase n=1 Tax=Phreatobacter sp. TaxID=1966341 RepID=UPI003F6F083F